MPRLTFAPLCFVASLWTSACVPIPVASKEETRADGSIAARFFARFPARELCADSFPYPWWCPLGVAATVALVPPAQPTSYLGVTAWVADGDRVQDALARQTALAVLHMASDSASLIVLKSDDAEERRELVRAYVSVARALNGRGDEVVVTEELAEYVRGQREATPRYPLRVQENVGAWQGALETYVWEAQDGGWGRVLVVVEEGAGGMYVSLFPMVGQTVKAMPAQELTDDTPEASAARRFAPHAGHVSTAVALRKRATSGQAAHPDSGPRAGGGGSKGKKPVQGGKKARGGQHKGR